MRNDNLEKLRSGDGLTAIMAAKAIVDEERPFSRGVVRGLATNRDNSEWSRVAAIYLLGMVGDRRSTLMFANILSDQTELPRCREYAAEALGHVHASLSMLPLLKLAYDSTTSVEIRRSCEFAIEAISRHGTKSDRRTL